MRASELSRALRWGLQRANKRDRHSDNSRIPSTIAEVRDAPGREDLCSTVAGQNRARGRACALDRSYPQSACTFKSRRFTLSLYEHGMSVLGLMHGF